MRGEGEGGGRGGRERGEGEGGGSERYILTSSGKGRRSMSITGPTI